MKGVVLFLAFVLMLSFVSGIEASIDCPDQVRYLEEFECSVEITGLQETHDLKIQIKGGGTTINKIWDGNEWARSDWYIDEYINSEGVCNVGIKFHKDFVGTAEGIFRLRPSVEGSSIDLEEIFSIEVVSGGDSSEANSSENEVENEDDSDYSSGEDSKDKDGDKNYDLSYSAVVSEVEENDSESVIVLGSASKVENLDDSDFEEKLVYQSKNSRVADYAMYGFSFFLIVIIGVILFRE